MNMEKIMVDAPPAPETEEEWLAYGGHTTYRFVPLTAKKFKPDDAQHFTVVRGISIKVGYHNCACGMAVVAVAGVHDWAAYAAPVDWAWGFQHIAATGDKVNEEEASDLFPNMKAAHKYYRS
jgi:hypothetical protein